MCVPITAVQAICAPLNTKQGNDILWNARNPGPHYGTTLSRGTKSPTCRQVQDRLNISEICRIRYLFYSLRRSNARFNLYLSGQPWTIELNSFVGTIRAIQFASADCNPLSLSSSPQHKHTLFPSIHYLATTLPTHTWPEYRSPIGWFGSRDWNPALWLAGPGHVTGIPSWCTWSCFSAPE